MLINNNSNTLHITHVIEIGYSNMNLIGPF